MRRPSARAELRRDGESRRAPLAWAGALCAALALLTLLLPVAGARADDDEEAAGSDQEVSRLREAIASSRERVVGHEREERELLELREELDRGLDALQTEVRRSEERAERAQLALADADVRRVEVRRRLARTRSAMSGRAVALYKAGEVGPVRVLFSSADLRELLSKVWTLERLLRYDASLIERFSIEARELMVVEEAAEQALVRRDGARERLASQSAILDLEREAKVELLSSVREDRSQERVLLVELERAARALEETMAGLGRGQEGFVDLDGSGFADRRGKLMPPVRGETRSRFGRVVDADYQTEIFRKGIEIEAETGDSVRSVAGGQVRYAGWFRGYGKIVILDHGDSYFTVSGHLADIYVDVGDPVAEGDTLGTVGETGSLSGPGLYFELREGGTPRDPARWLQSR
jgi:septal ring factor EnvC (AmiA/AmiB activator)